MSVVIVGRVWPIKNSESLPSWSLEFPVAYEFQVVVYSMGRLKILWQLKEPNSFHHPNCQQLSVKKFRIWHPLISNHLGDQAPHIFGLCLLPTLEIQTVFGSQKSSLKPDRGAKSIRFAPWGWNTDLENFMANQPTHPNQVPSYPHWGLMNHWFLLIRPVISGYYIISNLAFCFFSKSGFATLRTKSPSKSSPKNGGRLDDEEFYGKNHQLGWWISSNFWGKH